MKNYFRNDIFSDYVEGIQLDIRARLAIDFIRDKGMITGVPDGEDSTGRSKGTNMSIDDTVSRAFSLAEAVIKTAEERGYIKEIPLTPDEMAKERGRIEGIIRDASLRR
jgi:hypothetical protein